ncbi:transposase [Paenibacillus xylanexedens]|uniref:transposase n=1 Tax=Paenibacillus xylanexedens TaxID=528191 RepID=UPI00164270FD|nr:transposase [Paenibacillus xylanexedens]
MSAGFPEVELVKSIPGMGTKLAAAIVAEMGDIRQFNDVKQLVAFDLWVLTPGFLVQGS